jgi:hypothetical protein
MGCVRHGGASVRLRTRIRDLFPDALVDAYVAVRVHKAEHGKYPNLVRPRTFNEWVTRRKALERRPLLTQFSDKYRVRDYVAQRAGSQLLTQLYWVTRDPGDIPFDSLPHRFVVKPTHGSGWIRLVRDREQLDRAELIGQCRRWLAMDFYRQRREWPYKHVTPRILIEEFIADDSGEPATDYKFYVFGGRVELIQVDVARFVKHERSFFDRSWKRLDMTMRFPAISGEVAPPRHLGEMIRAAETLGRGTEFVRVDLYETSRKIYFGEITTTPVCGCAHFEPLSMDAALGALWTQARRRRRAARSVGFTPDQIGNF